MALQSPRWEDGLSTGCIPRDRAEKTADHGEGREQGEYDEWDGEWWWGGEQSEFAEG